MTLVRATRGRFKPLVDEKIKEIAGWSVAKALDPYKGGSPPLPATRATTSRFRARRIKFEHKEGGWSIAKSKEANNSIP